MEFHSKIIEIAIILNVNFIDVHACSLHDSLDFSKIIALFFG